MSSGTRYVTLVALLAALGGFLFGGDTSTLNGAIPGITPLLELTAGQVGFVAAVGLLGAAAGAWFAGPIVVRIGRTRVMGIAGALIAAGSRGAALAGGVVPLGISRVLTGLGIGAASAVVPSYITEISPTRIRGGARLHVAVRHRAGTVRGAAQQLGGDFGGGRRGCAAGGHVRVAVDVRHRRGGGAIYFLATRALPHSPHDLVRQGRDDEAREVLAKLEPREDADERLSGIRESVGEQKTTPTLSDLRGPVLGLKPIVWAGIALAVLQQLVGISVVKTYSNALWQAVGFGTNAAFGISIATVGVSIVATIIAIAIIDKVPRRAMLGFGAIACAIGLGVLAWAFSQAAPGVEGPTLDRDTGIIALVAVNVFALAFGITWGPVMWVMLGELFDSNLRVTAVAVATALNWAFNWLVTRTFPLLAAEGLGLAYRIYTAFAVLAALFVWKFLPETGGRRI
ncbi:MFS transporter [Paracoccus sp. S-4012]|uniref:MFS transporter n=1 Tax=Paracoccus sp. S-4012 TaxID=2665648 RepID=UPI0018A1CCCB|nr:MFS transporter [Paracoccus sp. S-4012]